MSDSSHTHPYDADYYRTYAGGPYTRNARWRRFFGGVADHIVRTIAPRTVLDAGCAMGFLVEALRERGVEAYGVDISAYAIDQVAPAIKPYCRVGSLTDPLPRRYDLIVSIEVIEHLTPADGATAAARMCEATDDILLSSTPDGYDEPTHLNVQPSDYWTGLFGSHGFVRDVDFDAFQVSPWAMRLRRQQGPAHETLRAYDRRFNAMAKELLALRALGVRLQQERADVERALDALTDPLLDREQQIWSLRNHVLIKDTYIASLLEHKGRADRHVEALLARVAGLEHAMASGAGETGVLRTKLAAIEHSRAWKVALMLRQLRDILLPVESRRAAVARRIWHTIRRQPSVSDHGSTASSPAPPPNPVQASTAAGTSPPAAHDSVAAPAPHAAPRFGRILIVNGSMGDMERYRCHHTREQAALAGLACDVCDLSSPALLGLVPSADVVILHRTQWGPFVHEIITKARTRQDVLVLYDIDDLLFVPELASDVQASRIGGPAEQAVFRRAMGRYRQMLDACDGLLAASEAIARAGRELGVRAWVHRNALSQTLIDLSARAMRQRPARLPGRRVVIGYASGSQTHDRDFLEAEAALDRMLDACPETELRIIGPLELPERWRAWGHRVSRVTFLPWQELPAALADFDINLAPLETGNAFCEGKSELKYFEAAAVGVPTVASRVGSFARAIRHGDNGFLAATSQDWFDALHTLVTQPALRREMGERARLDVLDRYSPATRAASLVQILAEADAARRNEAPATGGTVFREHTLAHDLLDGLTGLEIGAAAHNPFGLATRNVAPPDDYDFYAEESRRVMGVAPARVDIFAFGDALPVSDRSEDFVLSSHVVEHLPNVIQAFVEWNRVVKDGGYVFMIVPLKGALPEDGPRELTTLDHVVDDYQRHVTVDTHPVDGVPGGRMGHYHTFTPDSLHAVVDWMRNAGLCEWELTAREDVDTKVGNGFTLVYRVHHTHAGTAPA